MTTIENAIEKITTEDLRAIVWMLYDELTPSDCDKLNRKKVIVKIMEAYQRDPDEVKSWLEKELKNEENIP